MMETMREVNYRLSSLSDLPVLSKKILDDTRPNKLFLLFGEMGAGKTTLIKELCKQLGVEDPVTSPTFTILNEYLAKDDSPVYHFDFYRIKSDAEAYDLGYENYFFSGCYCFVEWPEKISSLLPEGAVKLYIQKEGENRNIKLHL